MSHAQRERLAYIDFRSYFSGETGRPDLIDRSGVAPAGVTRDLTLYREIASQNITFDGSNKIYRIGQAFSPLFDHTSQCVLSALALGFGDGATGATQPLPPCESPTALSNPRMDVLAPVCRAIHAKQPVVIRYRLMGSGESERVIVPLAPVDTGLCWYVRAFDRKNGEFRNFAVTHTEAPTLFNEEPQALERPDSDIQWMRIVKLDLVPHSRLECPEVIKMDYGMTDGSIRMRVRVAVAGYMLPRWSVDRSPDHRLKGEQYRLWLSDPFALYDVENARLAPGYQTPSSPKKRQERRKPMTKTLGAHDKLIREVSEGSYQLEIPDYQHPYAWTIEQAMELFGDLYAVMQDARISGASSQYFLGSIVLIKNDRDSKSSAVDGQQRLSTLMMLFTVLRTVMSDATKDITDFLYKKSKVSLGEKNEYRLTAREEDADFLRTNVQEPGGIAQSVAGTDKLKDSRLRYRENATLLLEKVKVLPPAELIVLWQFPTNDCLLVVISTPDLEATYRIFSVLNSRGFDLAPTDIIKAQVLGLIHTAADDVKSRAYAKEWSRIESSLGRNAFGDLFGHIRSIYVKEEQKYILVKELQEHVTEYKTPVDLVDKVIKSYTEAWDSVRDADSEATEHAETTNEHLS